MRKIFEQEKQRKESGPEAVLRKEKERVEKGISEIKDIVSDLVSGVEPNNKAVDGTTHA